MPGSVATFQLGAKEVKTWTNTEVANLEMEPSNPFRSSKLLEPCFKYPNLRLTASNYLRKLVIGLAEPSLIGEFFKNGKNYQKQYIRSFLNSMYTNAGVTGVEGDEWKLQRKVIAEAFHFDNIAKTVPIMEETVKEFLNNLKNTQGDAPCDIMDEFHKITGEVAGRTFFGQNLNEYKLDGKSLTTALTDLMKMNALLPYNVLYQLLGDINLLFSPELRKIKEQTVAFGEFTTQIFRESLKKIERNQMKNEGGRKGLLQILVEQGKTGRALTEKELIANFIVFFIAGTETTGHTANNAVYFLSQYPEVKEKAMKEIESCWDGKSPLTLEIIQKMDYLHALIEETLRLGGPTMMLFPRVAMQDHYLKDVPIKKGTIVFPLFQPSMLSEKHFKDPCTFKPERWIRGSEFYERPSDPFAFVPFSAGARNCIGQHMAMIEAKIILCHFLKKFEFRLTEGYKLEMVGRFLVEPKDPMTFHLTSKEEKK